MQIPPGAWNAPSESRMLEDAGLCVLKSGPGTPSEVFVLFDAGPKGILARQRMVMQMLFPSL